MPSLSIPNLTPGDPAIATDLLPISRSGANFSLLAGSIANANAFKTVSVDVSSSDILNLATTPKTIVPGVVGHSYIPLFASLAYFPGTKGYVDPTTPSFALTSVDAAVTTTYSLTQVIVFEFYGAANQTNYEGSISGGGSGAYNKYLVGVSGFGNAGNNGQFYASISSTSQIILENPTGVPETHSGTLTVGTTTYHGTVTGGGSNAFAGHWFLIGGFTNPANNGLFYCTASTATSLTLANFAGLAEANVGYAVDATATSVGQQFVLAGSAATTTPGTSPVNMPFYSPEIGVLSLDGFAPTVMALCGTLIPQVSSESFTFFQSSINGIGLITPGFPIVLALTNNPNFPTPSPLTGGDGTFTVTLTYLDLEV